MILKLHFLFKDVWSDIETMDLCLKDVCSDIEIMDLFV